MKTNNRFLLLLCFLFPLSLLAQDHLPRAASSFQSVKRVSSLPERGRRGNRTDVRVTLPATFRGAGINLITDSLDLLAPLLRHLHRVKNGGGEDTVRIVHVGDSHIRGHIFPRTTGKRLAETFGSVSYTDIGVNGATCLTFTHPSRIAAIAALKPELLILSFGTNESHNRNYNAHAHYQQMDELITLLRDSLPDTPILLTTPPGSYDSYRCRRRRTYTVNPRTAVAVQKINEYAAEHRLLVWDLYQIAGGSQNACRNWQSVGWMRPDHVHFTAPGYVLQGELLYEAILKAYNHYVFH